MLREFPEVEDYLRMNGRGPTVVEYKDQTFTEDHVVEADSTFFNFFSIPVYKGRSEKPSEREPRRAVVSESTAKRIFGDEDPIDKAIKIGNDTAQIFYFGYYVGYPGKLSF